MNSFLNLKAGNILNQAESLHTSEQNFNRLNTCFIAYFVQFFQSCSSPKAVIEKVARELGCRRQDPSITHLASLYEVG
jgi:hypothetical protein